jgi:hypothetical protein
MKNIIYAFVSSLTFVGSVYAQELALPMKDVKVTCTDQTTFNYGLVELTKKGSNVELAISSIDLTELLETTFGPVPETVFLGYQIQMTGKAMNLPGSSVECLQGTSSTSIVSCRLEDVKVVSKGIEADKYLVFGNSDESGISISSEQVSTRTIEIGAKTTIKPRKSINFFVNIWNKGKGGQLKISFLPSECTSVPLK